MKTPVAFERNDGQFEPGYDYVSRSLGYAFALHPGGAVMSLGRHEPLAMTITGADVDAVPTPAGRLATAINYYHRTDRSRWHESVPSFERVRYGSVYDRIDVEYYGKDGLLEYDFIVRPGGDPERIGIAFSGARALCIDERGALVLDTPAGEVRHGAPYVYQRNGDGTRRQIAARFELAENRIRFALDEPYDRSSDLIIDPTVTGLREVPDGLWFVSSMAADSAGNVFLTGATLWWDLLPVNAIREKVTHGATAYYGEEAFALKIAPDGTVVYATYLGGDGFDRGVKVAVDGSGNAYFTGETASSDFPTSATAFQRMPVADPDWGTEDIFLTKLSPAGTLVYSTYFGAEAEPLDLAVDASGKAYVSGITSSPGFPGTVDERTQHRAWFSGGGFVAKFNSDASATEFVTLLGADSGLATPYSIAVDDTGAVYVGGGMGGAAMRTTAGVYQPQCRKEYPGAQHCFDGFVAKLTPAGAVDRLTFLGGTHKDEVKEIAVNDDHEVFVLGETLAGDFPVTANAVQSSKYADHTYDCFYARLDPTLAILEYSTYLGGDHWENARDLTLDSEGRAVLFVGGSEDFPLLGTMGYDINRTHDVLLRFSAANQLQFSSLVPGSAMAVHPADDTIYVTDGALVREVDGSGSGTTFLLRPRVSPPGRSEDEADDFWESIGVSNEIGVFSGTPQVTIGGLSATVTSSGGDDHVTARVPANLPFGIHDVTVTDPVAGTFTFNDAYEYTAGEISVAPGAIVPNTVPARLFTTITITGSGFPRGAVVTLDDGFGSDDYTLPTERISSTTLRALVSMNVDPGVYDVTISASDTYSVGFLPGALTVAHPGIGGFSPPTGPSSGGTLIELSAPEGSDAGYGVTVDGIPATSLGYSSPYARFALPAHAPGRVDVVVTTPLGSRELPDAFFYYQAITATEVSPLNGPPAGGTPITITGTGFLPGAQVTLDGIRAIDVVVESSTTITAITPPRYPGAVDIVVRNPDSGTASVPVRFTYDGPFPHGVTRMEGSSYGGGPNAPVTGGATVAISGEGFAAGVRVFFGDTEATVTSVTVPYEIKVTSPPHPEGKVDLIVVNPDGATGVLEDSFTFTGTGPAVTGISPSTGPASGGTAVTITGTGFDPDAEVTIGGSTLLEAVVGATSITGITPPRPDGSHEVRVTNPDDLLTDTTTFIYTAPPEISSVSPSTGPSSGGTVVTINGSNFSIDAEVYFGGTPAQSVLWEGSSQLLVGSPAHSAGTFEVTVTNGDGQSATKNGAFRFLPPAPTITGFTPSHGAPGSSVVINGTSFQFVSGVKFFNNRTATYSVNNSGQITATVPSFAETGPITVTTESGTATSASNFTVDETAPEITSFTPGTGGPGTAVTITGMRFTGATSVEFGGFGGAYTVDSDTQITATVPGSAKSGPIVVRSAAGVGTSEATFLVPPRFSGSNPFTPKFGLPGTAVTINGVNFGGTTQVLFNGVSATPFTVNAAGTSITTTVPAAATTGFISVTAEGGTAMTTTKFAVTPQVDSFTPTSGPTGGSVVLTGVRFTGATAVTFGGVNAASFTVNSDTQITAVTSSGAKTGTVCVTTPGATGCSTGVFSLPPRFSSTPFSPSSGLPGTSISINGVNFQGTTAVSFNAIAATTFSANAAGTKITVTVPEGATTGPVSVTAQGGSATSTKNFGVPPVVSSFAPPEGGAGTTVTLTGVRFTGATAVKFGTVAATSFSVVSDTQITAVVSSTAKTGTICVTTPGGTGCSASSFTVPPRITSFTPANALPGAPVTINGSNFHGATSVTFFNGQAASPFTVNAAGTAITTTVPANATTGPVTVVTPVGSGTSTVNFGVQPAISGFTPSQGEAGTTVTITGVRFTGATAVKFGGTSGASSTSVTVVSDTQITATVPSSGKSGTICVTTPGGTGCSGATFSMPPRVTGFDPDRALPGATVEIEGVNFHGATAVSFFNGQAAAPITVNAAGTLITTTLPAAAITGPVTVTTPIGSTTSTLHFGVIPAVTGFDPVTGEAGTTVTITGVRLTGASAVKFGGTSGGTATTFSVVNDTTVTAVVPATGKSGTICVTTPGGTGCSTGTFSMPPRITGFTPASALPGANVTINGANFQDATAVSFNGVAQPTFTVNSAGTSVTTTVPTGATTGQVTVTTPIGTATSAANFGVQAVVSGFTPTSGDVGTLVTITGERFTGATAVKFGGSSGVAATVFTVVDAQTITAEVPAAPKSGTVCVTTAASTACSSGTFSVPPRITGFNTAAALPGGNVTINGFNFQSASAVSFNGTPQPVFTVNAAGTSIATTVPAGATTGPVSVTTPFGTGTSATNFGVLPAVTGFTPSTGAAGDTITITGERLANATGVKFGGSSGVAATTFSAVNATTVTAVVPATAKTGTICVTTAAGTGCSAGTFTVGPRITSFSPTSALPGASVTITGLNFQGTTAVAFNGVNQPAFTVNAAGTSVTTTVPAGATTGPITVTTPVATATSATHFGVLPAVSGFTPSAGGPGTVVTVTGVRFTGATTVKFNTTTATFTLVDDTTITATVPASATTGKIGVTTPAGTATSAASFTIGPKITSFSPTKGAPGTAVTINGSAFTGATAVAFGGVAATTFTVNSSSKITATVPAAARTGVISVTTPAGGTGFSAAKFYLPAAVTGFSPGSGAPGTAVTITGTNFNEASAVAFNGLAAAFSLVSPEQITATVPEGATTGPLSVTTPFGPSSSASSFTVLAAPPPLLAATGATSTSVAVSWTGSAAAQYDVQRATSAGGPFATLTRVTGLSYNDTAASSNTAYLYRVVRVHDGVTSNVDHTTTVVFSDDPVATKLVRRTHLNELRAAVNALRSCAGLAPAAWTDPTPAAGLRIKAVHTTELRSALSSALAALGVSATFTDPALTGGMMVKAAHHQEIRAAVR